MESVVDSNHNADVGSRGNTDNRPRHPGDGAPVSMVDSEREVLENNRKPFTVQVEFDIMQMILTALSVISRTWQLGYPRAVVFDELHFAKFVTLYLRKMFFFDVHPPLGKMILAAAGSYAGYEGNVTLDRIGQVYPGDMPVFQMRLVPAILGSLIVPVVYQIIVELGLTRWAAVAAASFILLDNALLVQSRFMLMEGMLIFFLALSVLSYLKFKNLNHREFSTQWYFWLILCGLSFTLTLSIKYIGCFVAVMVVFFHARDYWNMLADYSRSDMNLIKHIIIRIAILIFLPIVTYISIFYVHLTHLTKAGPHDNIMTSAFQASLEGGLAALTKGQPLNIAYGSQITLRHTYDSIPGKPCWLHSHNQAYPIRYPDNRGSSHQQQVTCYVFKDVNNWWIVKDPSNDSLAVEDPPRPVQHGDIIQLIHGITSRALNSHDVAAPVSPQNQEVSCYIDYNVSMPAQHLWRVEILNQENGVKNWQTIKSHVRLVHVNTTAALKMTGKQLPEWGSNQLEISADRIVNQPATIWNVEEHKYTTSVEKDKQSLDLRQSEMIPLEPTHLSFWSKFLELHFKMIFSSQDSELEHKYSSEPLDWPFDSKNLAYWMSPHSNAQIHLLGNPVVWYCGTIGVLVYLLVIIFYMLRRRRQIYDITDGEFQNFVFIGEVLVGGYLLHYLPFYLADRTMFLHNYLPAIIFKVMAFTAFADHIYGISLSYPRVQPVIRFLAMLLLSGAIYAFLELSVFTYGKTNLTAEQIHSLTWKENWDFLLQVRHK